MKAINREARTVAKLNAVMRRRARKRFLRNLRNQAGETLNAFCEKSQEAVNRLCIRIDTAFWLLYFVLIVFAPLYFGGHFVLYIGRTRGWWK